LNKKTTEIMILSYQISFTNYVILKQNKITIFCQFVGSTSKKNLKMWKIWKIVTDWGNFVNFLSFGFLLTSGAAAVSMATSASVTDSLSFFFSFFSLPIFSPETEERKFNAPIPAATFRYKNNEC